MNKLKLFEITFNKLSDDKSYVAYFLNQLMITENKTQQELIELLNCSEEDYFKLALCKAPEMNAVDFKKRIEKIAGYTNTSEIILANIIGHSSIAAPKQGKQQPSLLAESLGIFKKLIPIPAWIYQPLITTLIILLFVIPVFSSGNGTKHLQLYVGDYILYTDSVKYLLLPDKTVVYKNNL